MPIQLDLKQQIVMMSPPSPSIEKTTETKTKTSRPIVEEQEQVTASAVGTSNFFHVPFKTSSRWGVKDSSGEWINFCQLRHLAEKTYADDPRAFQLIEGCDPWAALDDSIVETFTVLAEKKNVLDEEGVS